MKYLWPAGGNTGFGVLAAPNMLGVPSAIVSGALWAADLGCLEGPEFVKRCDIEQARQWLFETMRPYCRQCLFVTVPDVVGDAVTTLKAFGDLWLQFIGWPLAYVAQDGAEALPIPSTSRAVFVGGSTDWKLSSGAVEVIKRAVDAGKHVHVGRVNYYRRYSHFAVIAGSENFTCDGTRQRYERNKALVYWRAYQSQLSMELI